MIRLQIIATLVAALLCFAPPLAAAGSYQVVWNGDGTITQHGFAAKVDLGAGCSFPGNAAAALAGSFPGNGGCFFLFTAPGAATIQSVSVAGHYSKATSDANLCARSFAGVGSPSPLVACAGGDFAQTIPIASGTWTELGLYNQSSAPVVLSTSNANNALFTSGAVVMNDPTPPLLSVTASIPAFVGGDAFAVHFSASDPESRAGLVSWTLDGGGGGPLVSDGCADVFVCGASSSGDFSVAGLTGIPDGAHTVSVHAHSAGGDTAQDVGFTTDHSPPQLTSGLSVDYASRIVSVLVQDATAGVANVALYADGAPLATLSGVAAGKPAGTLLVTGRIPQSARLDGAVIDVVASDAATPANILDTRSHAGQELVVPVRPPAPATPVESAASVASGATPAAVSSPVTGATPRSRKSKTLLTLSLRVLGAVKQRSGLSVLHLTAGEAAIARGRLHGATGKRRIVLRLGSGKHAQRWRTVTNANGVFQVRIQPRVGGVLVANYAGASGFAPTSKSGFRVVITPRISVHITATRLPGGYVNPSVRGHFSPAGGVPVVLAWQARAPHGSWQLVGSVNTTIEPDRHGDFAGTLPITLGASVALRLVYVPTPTAFLTAAASRAALPTVAP